MHLDPFELYRPSTVEEVVRLTRDLGAACDVLAGGTDLLPNYKMHINLKPNLVALEEVEELRSYTLERVGSMTRLADLDRDTDFARAYPGVAAAVHEVATPLVRERATVGGNLLVETRCFFFNQTFPWRQSLGFCLKADGDRCHVVPQKERCYATFSGDLAPALAAVDASVELAGPDGRRTIPVLDLYDPGGDGIRRHRLRPNEIVVAVSFPAASRGLPANYQKLRIRPTFDFPELGLAAAGLVESGTVRSLAIAAGGLETYPRRFDEVTRPLVGERLNETNRNAASEAIMRSVRPVHNTFLAPDYRRRMVGVYVRRALDRLANGPPGVPG
ncbi:MAG: FAD binding domain-containing protein [Thermoplasmata archaeon]|nr:FAD binding domain-containing protein [Thermoplasmata archaeon]MCI4358916.1 FAD binding domain-containing protein [Thermoplasmata archaeon]